MTVAVLPDAERRTPYTVSSPSTGPLDVGFNIWGDGSDYAQWIEVWDDGVQLAPIVDFTVDSPSGSLATLARPITDARVTFTSSRSGNIQIVGARRPRRLTQFPAGQSIGNDDFNRAYSDLMAIARESYDKLGRAVLVNPGEDQATAAEILAAATTATEAAATAVAAADGVYNSFDYETRATAAATQIPVIRTTIRVLRHTTGYPLDPAPYKPGTVAGPMAFQDALGNYWELDLGSGRAGAAWFGARGNGVANDTTAIQAALNSGARVVYLLKGDFITSVDLTLPTGVSLIGTGNRTPAGSAPAQTQGTTIHTTHANAKAIKTAYSDLTSTDAEDRSYNHTIQGLSIVRDSGTVTNSVGLYLTNLNYSVVRDVIISGFAGGMVLAGYGLLNTFDNLTIFDTSGGDAIYIHTNPRANTFHGCYIVCLTANKACVRIEATTDGALNNVSFFSCRFDAAGGAGDVYGIHMSGSGTLSGGGNTANGIWIGGCFFDMSATGTEYGIYQASGAYYIHAAGNQMTGVTHPYHMNDPDNFVVLDHTHGSGRLRSQQFCIYDTSDPNVGKALLRHLDATRIGLRNFADNAYADLHVNTLLVEDRFRITGGTATASAAAATLSQIGGVITTEALTTAAAAIYTLTLTNTKVTASSLVFASVQFGTCTAGTPHVCRITPGSGSVAIQIRNDHASAAFDGTLKISFFVVKTISE